MRRDGAITVAIADPETAFRVGVRQALADERFLVVAEGDTLAATLDGGGAVADVLLVDEALGGSEVAFSGSVGVVARRPSIDGLKAAVALGALGYIPRDVPVRRLPPMVEDLAAGIGVIPSSLGLALLAGAGGVGTRADGSPVTLTSRQAQIQRMAQEGLRTAEIAELLSLSPVTVRRHLSDLQAKLGRRVGARRAARRPQTLGA